MKKFRKRMFACMENRRERERKEQKGEYYNEIRRDENGSVGMRERERKRKRRREVVGGSGPYREAGTTLASAILRAKDIHNHLVPLALSRGTRVVVTRHPLLDIFLGRLVASFHTRRREPSRKRSLDVFTSPFLHSSRFLPVSNSLNFLLLPFDARENFRNFARPFKASTRVKKRSSVYTSRSRREREIKAGDFASFRASPLFAWCSLSIGFCINRNLLPPKTKPP